MEHSPIRVDCTAVWQFWCSGKSSALISVIVEPVATKFSPEDINTTFLQNVCNQALDNTLL
jgi:hypothetical protein